MAKATKKGAKGRKIGRHARKPASKRYTATQRWITNKFKRVRQNLSLNHKQQKEHDSGPALKKALKWLDDAKERAARA